MLNISGWFRFSPVLPRTPPPEPVYLSLFFWQLWPLHSLRRPSCHRLGGWRMRGRKLTFQSGLLRLTQPASRPLISLPLCLPTPHTMWTLGTRNWDWFKVVLQTWCRFLRNSAFLNLSSNLADQLFTFISKKQSLFFHKSTSFGLVLWIGGQLCYISSCNILSSPESGQWQWPRSIHHLQAEPEWYISL